MFTKKILFVVIIGATVCQSVLSMDDSAGAGGHVTVSPPASTAYIPPAPPAPTPPATGESWTIVAEGCGGGVYGPPNTPFTLQTNEPTNIAGLGGVSTDHVTDGAGHFAWNTPTPLGAGGGLVKLIYGGATKAAANVYAACLD